MKPALLLCFAISGCASLNIGRTTQGGLIGAAAGAGVGMALSPNKESVQMNGLVFGITGAIAGGTLAYLTRSKAPKSSASNTLDERAQAAELASKTFQVPLQSDLPAFVRERLTPVEVEEFELSDLVSDDGTLHGPHKAYRIKRNAELVPVDARREGAKP
jgi:hypothetical protein